MVFDGPACFSLILVAVSFFVLIAVSVSIFDFLGSSTRNLRVGGATRPVGLVTIEGPEVVVAEDPVLKLFLLELLSFFSFVAETSFFTGISLCSAGFFFSSIDSCSIVSACAATRAAFAALFKRGGPSLGFAGSLTSCFDFVVLIRFDG